MNHLSVNVHVDGTIRPRVQIGARTASVALGDWTAETVVYGTDPAHLVAIAEAFTDAARQLSAELDKQAAREVNAAAVPA